MTEQLPERDEPASGSTDERARVDGRSDGGEERENDLTADEPVVDPADADEIVPPGGIP